MVMMKSKKQQNDHIDYDQGWHIGMACAPRELVFPESHAKLHYQLHHDKRRNDLS